MPAQRRALPDVSPLAGKRVTVMGLGRHGGGVAATRWLASQGCRVTVTDRESPERLAGSLAEIADVAVERLILGGHDEQDFRVADLLVVNPAVTPSHPLLALARQHGATITSEIELFLERCPASIVGITGTTGKTTTATMLDLILRAAGRTSWLGGNLGRSLLGQLDAIQAENIVVLELSSFQLAHLSATAPMPDIAVVTNCSQHHLDWHGSWQNYVAAKQRLIVGPTAAKVAVLNDEDMETRSWRQLSAGEIAPLVDLRRIPKLQVAGGHNLRNARLAASAAVSLDIEWPANEHGLTEFAGLDHRQQLVGEKRGRRFINDSKSTSASAAIAAMKSLPGRIWWLAGGVAESVDYRRLAHHAHERTCGAAFFGSGRQILFDAISSTTPEYRAVSVETLADAIAWAMVQSSVGDTILLSPACASFDQFDDFEHRGRSFCKLVAAIDAEQF